MSLKLSFSKTNLLSFTRNPSGGSAKLCCRPSDRVSKAMGWGEFPDWTKCASPAGALITSTWELTPSEGDLAKHAVQLAGVNTVRDFEFVKKQIKKGKTSAKAPGFKIELHFVVDFTDPSAARKLEGYFQCGASDGTLAVTYEKEAEQLELAEGSGDQLELTDVQKKRAAGKEDE